MPAVSGAFGPSRHAFDYRGMRAPLIVGGTLQGTKEKAIILPIAPGSTGNTTLTIEGALYSDWYYTTNASANWTFNLVGANGTPLNQYLSDIGDMLTVAIWTTQGGTAYYASAFKIDGIAVTPKYFTGTAFTAGNASALDVYLMTAMKTAQGTFVMLASQTKYA